MTIGMLAAWWVVSFSLVMTPGPDWAYTIAAGMRDRAIVPAITGTLLGYVMITAVVAAGVGTLVATVPGILTLLTLFGSGYLVWLGAGILSDPPVPTSGAARAESTWAGWLVRGFAVTGTNPKALLLFLALLPQFTSHASPWPIPAQIAAMGLVQILNCAVVYAVVGLGSRAVLRTRPQAARRVGQVSGAAMILIALLLLGEQVLAWSGTA